jgi:hypothetical protein
MARRRRNPKPLSIGIGVAVAGVVGLVLWDVLRKKAPTPFYRDTAIIPPPRVIPGANAAPAAETPMADTFAAAGVPYVPPPLYTVNPTQPAPYNPNYVPPGAALPAGT